MKRAVLILVAICCVGATAPAGAGAIDQIGQNPPSANNNFGCTTCSLIQVAESGAPSYVVPYDGVITTFYFQEGTAFSPPEAVAGEVWRPLGGGSYRLVGRTAPTSVATPTNFIVFDARLSVKAGDILGLRAEISGLGNTDTRFVSAAGDDVLEIGGPATAVGDIAPAGTTATSRRVNVSANLEVDADNDGFGDESQDLCVGDGAHGDTACSGSLIGSQLTDYLNTGAGCFALACIWYPTNSPGASAVAPVNGVVVRWRIKTGSTPSEYRLRVLKPLPSGDIQSVRTGPSLTYSGSNQVIVRSSEIRVPIAAGETIGMQVQNGVNVLLRSKTGAQTAQHDSDLPDGNVGGPTLTWADTEWMFNADVEPDADGDQYGDVTQDGCPQSAASFGICPADLSAVSLTNRKFRVNTAGSVISAAKKGTALKFSLLGAGDVSVTAQRALPGRLVGSKCRKPSRANARRSKCTRYVTVHKFTRSASAGAQSIKYSGRYRKNGKTRKLAPGKYRFKLDGKNGAGASTAFSPTFTVVRR